MKLGLVACVFVALAACRPAADPVRGLAYTHHAAPAVNTLHVPVWLDDKLPQAVRQSTAGALAEWNQALNGYLTYEIAAPEQAYGATPAESLQWRIDHQSRMLLVKAAFANDADYPEDGVIGWVEPDQLNVLHIVCDLYTVRPAELKTVIMHEIAHTLGLEHTKHVGLIFPYYNEQPTCIDHLTVQQLAASHEWDDRRMNWCE